MAEMHEIDYQIFGDDMQFVEIELDPQEAGNVRQDDLVHEQQQIVHGQPDEAQAAPQQEPRPAARVPAPQHHRAGEAREAAQDVDGFSHWGCPSCPSAA